MGEFLALVQDATGGSADLRWCDDRTLLGAGMSPFFVPPLWVPSSGPMAGVSSVDTTKAVAAGMRFRPAEETVRDTWAWMRGSGVSTDPVWPRSEEGRVLEMVPPR